MILNVFHGLECRQRLSAYNQLSVGGIVRLRELFPQVDTKATQGGCQLTGECYGHIVLLSMLNERTACSCADKWRFDKNDPLCSVTLSKVIFLLIWKF